MTAREGPESGEERRRAAVASARLAAVEVEHLDPDAVEDLAVGREVEDALAAGNALSDVALSIGYTEAVASDLLGKFRAFREILAARNQNPLF